MVKALRYAALAGAFAVSVAAAGDAKADSYAYSYFLIDDATITSNGTQLSVEDFDFLNISNNASDFATLTGYGAAGNTDTTTGSVSVDPAFVGDGGIGDNAWDQSGLGPNYARSDADLAGTLLAPGAATSQVVGEALVSGDTGKIVGSTSAYTDTTTEFSFSPTQDLELTLSFTASYELIAQITEESTDLQNASASIDFVVQIFDLGTDLDDTTDDALIFTYNPLNEGRSINSVGVSDDFLAPTAFSTTSPLLLAGNFYRVYINQTAETNVTANAPFQVPEPGTLGLLGTSLIGLGLVSLRRRRDDKAA